MRIVILTASTGGGHDMRAAAFMRWIERLTDWEAKIHRPLEQSHRLYGFGVELYNWIQRTAPFLHHIYYGFLELASLHRRPGRILGAKRFLSYIETVRPNVIVSTHAHLNHGFFELAREKLGHSNVRCVTYCGELGGGYGFSHHWINPNADLFIGAVDDTVDAAIALGMPESKTWSGGFMLFPEFYDSGDEQWPVRPYIHEQLGMDADKFVLLLATGSAGANNHVKILGGLERRAKPVQVVVLCGHNERTFKAVESWGRRASAVRLKALGYRRDMPQLLRSVSAVVSRPGTGTTSEAIMSDCPLIMNGIGGVMPQESITVRYMMRHKMARIVRRPAEVGEVLDAWERNPQELDELKSNMRARRPMTRPRDILERTLNCELANAELTSYGWQWNR